MQKEGKKVLKIKIFGMAVAILLMGQAFVACAAPASVETDVLQEQLATPTATPVPTEEPTESPQNDATLFENSVFIGNSCVDSLFLSGAIDGATYLYRTGMTVSDPFEKSTDTGSIPVMDELEGKNYNRVFLVFGENELGWVNTDLFVQRYKEVIDGVRERLPDAKIYVTGITPVTEDADQRNKFMVNNSRICEFNELLKQIAEDKVATYIDLYTAMVNENGVLPDGLSSDGVHPNAKACEIWAETMTAQLKGETQ